ncbi:MAG: SBBP repeat-containing protein [Bryobacteraceae bacterium]|nr:SBBP repeat-containing protein [Bryobacteraceae bacterium]
MRHQLLAFVLSLSPIFAGKAELSFRLPDGASVRAVRSDDAGNLYIAGSLAPSTPGTGDFSDAFVAKLSAGGSQIYRTVLAGSNSESATAIVLAPDGSLYLAGGTSSSDFPVTPGAPQATLGAGGQAFLAKLSPAGELQSATYFGGGAATSGSAVAITPEGHVLLTGIASAAGFPATPGNTDPGNGFYLARFDAALRRILLATPAHGGTVITLDPQGNIYLAGSATPVGVEVPLQTTPGAFQARAEFKICRGSGIVFLPCGYQFVKKLDPTATRLVYATFLTGSHGASPAAIAVDAAGNVIVAGTTNSPDYPVTAGALQTLYLANAAEPPIQPSPRPTVYPPPSTGYITKLNATGTGLLWSTFYGGSARDAISGMTVDRSGFLYITGQASSSDLPGMSASTPGGCRPSVNQSLGFVARLTPDGASVAPAQLIYGAPVCTYGSCFADTQSTSSSAWSVAVRTNGDIIAAAINGALASIDLFAPDRLACATDPADHVQVTSVAPGQVLSIFGSRIGPARALVPPGGSASSLGGIAVTFNGIVAPILFTSGEQVNVQVPFEIAGQDSVEMRLVNSGAGFTEHKSFRVQQRQPSVFLSRDATESGVPGASYCGNEFSRAQHALVLNADGTLNTCSDGAAPGSTVTLFLNGLGPIHPGQATGSIVSGPPVEISPGATGAGILSTTTSPGAISGVARIRIEIPPTSSGFFEVTPAVAGVPVRQPILIWVGAR